MPQFSIPFQQRGFGFAWLLLCMAFAFHVWDEATHDFLGYFNATVLALYGHFSWFPRMDMTFRGWLLGLLIAIVVLLALTAFAFQNARWLRPLAYVYAVIQLANGIGHTLLQIRGGTVASVRFDGISPGFRTAPLLIIASLYLFWRLRKTEHQRSSASFASAPS
jgi:hypothetical protein